MTGRSAALLAAVALVAVVAVAALTLPRQGPIAASPSPSPSPTAQPTPSGTPSASPATSPTPTPSRSPAPSPGGVRFVDALAGYSIDLSAPWRRSTCWSRESGVGADVSTYDAFVPVSAYDEESGHTGLAHDHVEVSAQPNPGDLTPREWYSSGRAGRSADDRLTETTLAGEPALRIVSSEWDRYLVSHGELMFDVAGFARRGESTPEQRAALIATFRFLTDAERNVARAQPTPTPSPRSAEQVVDTLADGFARKDVAILATVIRNSCVSYGFAEAGASTKNSQRYLDELKARFAGGLTVEVQRGTLGAAEGIDNPARVVRSTWSEPGQPDHRIHLTISPEGGRWSWSGTVDYGPIR